MYGISFDILNMPQCMTQGIIYEMDIGKSKILNEMTTEDNPSLVQIQIFT